MSRETFDPTMVRPLLPDTQHRADPKGRRMLLMGPQMTQRSAVVTTSRKTDRRPVYEGRWPRPIVGSVGNVEWPYASRPDPVATRLYKNLL